MRTQPLESSIMLAGLTRGLWGVPVDRQAESRDTGVDATSWRSALLSDAEMPGIDAEDRATDSTVTPCERR